MQHKLLLVDDDRLIRQMLQDMLEEAGFLVFTAENGEGAVARAEECLPEIILLDLHMPVMDGIEACRRLRAMEPFRHAVILLITGHKEMQGRVNPFEVGADDYLSKPVLRDDLLARIRGSLHKKRIIESLERQARESAALLEVTGAVNSTLDTAEILRQVVTRIADEIEGVFRCSIALIGHEQQSGDILASSDDPELAGLRIDLSRYPEVQQVLETGQPLLLDVLRDPLLAEARSRIPQGSFNTVLVLPVISREKVLGVMLVRAQRRRPGFSREEIEFCRLVANVSACALQNARCFEIIREESAILLETKNRLEEELRIKAVYEQIFEHASEGLVAFDAGGAVVFANRRALEITGYRQDQLHHRRLSDLLDFRSLRQVMKVVRGPQADAIARFDVSLKTPDGCLKKLSVSLDHRPVGDRLYVIAFRDVTEKRQVESDLVATKARLEEANERLRKLDRARAEFLNTAAHELRIPVTILNGYLSLLQEFGTDNLTPEQREYLQAAVESSDRMVDLTNNMLDLSRLEAGKMEMAIGERDLCQAIGQVCRDFKPLAMRNGIDLDLGQAAECRALFDEDQIRRVLSNLVGNAIKFTPPGGRIEVRLAHSSDEIEVAVHDTGKGIPPERISELFDEFVQLRTDDSHKGTGLGLSICKRIIDSHQGRIWAESAPGEGSRFVFTLPRIR